MTIQPLCKNWKILSVMRNKLVFYNYHILCTLSSSRHILVHLDSPTESQKHTASNKKLSEIPSRFSISVFLRIDKIIQYLSMRITFSKTHRRNECKRWLPEQMNSSSSFQSGGSTVQQWWRIGLTAISRVDLPSDTIQMGRLINFSQGKMPKSSQLHEVQEQWSDSSWDSSGRWDDSDSSDWSQLHSKSSEASQKEQILKNKHFSIHFNPQIFMIQKSQLPLILITAFLDILGISLFIPVLPSIIEGFSVNPSWTGYTQAFYALGMFVGGLFFWKLSDRFGRRKILTYTSVINLLSYVIMLISIWTIHISNWVISHSPIEMSTLPLNHIINLFEGFTPLFVLFLFARFVGGLGGAGFGVIQAYISDISSPEEKTKNMGFMGAAFGTAFLIGPAIGGLLSTVTSISAIVMLCIIVISINVFSIFFFLEEPKKHADTVTVHLKDFHFSHTVILLLFLSFWSTLGFAAVQSMSTQFYADRFHFDATKIGLTMAMVWLISVVYQGWLVRFVRKHLNEVMMIRLAFFILAIGFIGFSMNQSPYFLFFWIALFPLGMGSFQPSVSSLMAQNAGKEVGKVMGYNTSIQSIGQILGPIMAGLLYVTPWSGLPFYVSAGIFGILFILAFWTKEEHKKRENNL